MIADRIKYRHLLIISIAFIALLNIGIFEDTQANAAFALLLSIASLWISEALPLAVTALIIPVAAALLGLLPVKLAFAEFSNPILFLFMGGFVLAGALSRHDLDKYFAIKLIALARGNFYWSSVFLMLGTALIGCWVSNTASVAMMIPMAMGLLVLAKKDESSPESVFLLLGIAYSASIGGIITIIGSPPNGIGASMLGMSFLGWLRFSLPLFLMLFPAMIWVLTLYFKPDRSITVAEVLSVDSYQHNKSLTYIFAFIILLWSTDTLLAPLFGIESHFSALVGVIAIVLIYISRIMTWDEILGSVQWNVLLLFGGGLTLGAIIESSGLGAILIGSISNLLESVPLLLFIWIVVACTIILSEFMSNTATAALLLPLLYSMARGLNIDPVVLILPATIAASMGFMLPVGTPPNAMVFATGHIEQRSMLRVGFVLNLCCSLIVATYFYLVLVFMR